MEIYNDCLQKNHKKLIDKPTKSIEECLQPKGISPFQALMLEIRNNFILKIKDNREIGKSCVQTSLPQHLDPVYTSFGTRRKDPFTLADILNENYKTNLTDTDLPGKQINRKYKKPFCSHKIYGKPSNAEQTGKKVKKLMCWFTETQKIKESDCQLQEYNPPQNLATDKSINHNSIDMYEILHECPEDVNLIKLKKCLSHVNSIRLQIKKRNSGNCFFALKEYFQYIDENNLRTINLNTFYSILKEMKIILEKENFEYLLQKLNLIKEESIYYEEALDLLNWKCKFPQLPKIDDISTKCEYYTTTYQELMKL